MGDECRGDFLKRKQRQNGVNCGHAFHSLFRKKGPHLIRSIHSPTAAGRSLTSSEIALRAVGDPHIPHFATSPMLCLKHFESASLHGGTSSDLQPASGTNGGSPTNVCLMIENSSLVEQKTHTFGDNLSNDPQQRNEWSDDLFTSAAAAGCVAAAALVPLLLVAAVRSVAK